MFGQMAQDTLLASSRVLPARLEAMGFSFGDPLIAPALKSLL
jgi:NAD dependent epimerase/dehydratase family enzyme